MLQATYSPEDNKLRLYASSRLDSETYARVKAVGFIWAPKQDLFVAPMWTPARADLLIELCGEIEDEDKSLVERAEERADRFGDYSDKRQADANAAHKAVSAIAAGIPFGQPILVGHHSERRARKDASRIENGMRKAVQCWETAGYWKQRAAGALSHAKYKELPAVRARRIKGIEADKRKQERNLRDAEVFLKAWQMEGLTFELAMRIANHSFVSRSFSLSEYPRELPASQYEGPMYLWSALDGRVINEQQALEIAVHSYQRQIAHATRWIAHCENRLTYEIAMLNEQGAGALLAPKPRRELLPLCNYRAPEGIKIPNRYHRGQIDHYPQVDMTKAEYAAINKDYKSANAVDGTHRVRTAMVKHSLVCVFLTDSKVHTIPAAPAAPVAPIESESESESKPAAVVPPAPVVVMQIDQAPAQSIDAKKDDDAAFRMMREQIRQGVEVVCTPNLFPTPAHLAERMVELANIQPGEAVLEPQGGTGRIIAAILSAQPLARVVSVEIEPRLVAGINNAFPEVSTICGDFLRCNPDNVGLYDVIIMNPPFGKDADIKHIKNALLLLKPRGRLVTLCAAGPRQYDTLKPLAEATGGTWERLPQGTFKDEGTNVNTVLLTIHATHTRIE